MTFHPALIPSPLLPTRSRRPFPQSELLEYTNHVIDKFGLRKQARTNQTVTRLTYDESACLWHVETELGEIYSARFVIDTSGVLANPHTPNIKGAETFKGPKFHAGQWDHSVCYEGKRVAVISLGCSAAQGFVPAIAAKVSRLTLLMGKAQWVLPRSDRRYSALERSVRTLPGIRHLIRLLMFTFYDMRFFAFRYSGTSMISQFMKGHYRRKLKKHLEKYIKDDKLREHMTPDYELGCRRVIPTNAYLPALSVKMSTWISAELNASHPKASIKKTNNGKEIPLDVIVYATGYFAYSNMKKALTFDVYGLGGRNLNREWEKEAVSYKGITVSGYPNYFKVNSSTQAPATARRYLTWR